jgi:molybdopterin biosynthesis enzyme MoaB
VTPEATLQVLQRVVPGFSEAMRAASLAKTPFAMISRGVCGIRGRTLILNLPGSPAAAVENLEAIWAAVPHTIGKLQGDPSDCAPPQS